MNKRKLIEESGWFATIVLDDPDSYCEHSILSIGKDGVSSRAGQSFYYEQVWPVQVKEQLIALATGRRALRIAFENDVAEYDELDAQIESGKLS